MGIGSLRGVAPPPPRSIGIIELGGNLEKILELQSVAGKILWIKELTSQWGGFVMALWAVLRIVVRGFEVKVI
jgi:hypothetical protein